MSRRKKLGNLGERLTEDLLVSAGFQSVQNLNRIRPNHPGGDFLGERHGKRYFITVKARCKYRRGTQQLNGGYNIFPEKVRIAARKYDAIPAWLAIQVDTDRRRFSAYFGTVESLRNPDAVAVPMTVRALSGYESLANDKFDQAVTPELSNQLANPKCSSRLEISEDMNGQSNFQANQAQARGDQMKKREQSLTNAPESGGISFEDHLAYTEPPLRPVLRELRKRINSLGQSVEEVVTEKQRIAYSVRRQFVEVKVQKKRILVRFFGMGVTDPRKLVTEIPKSHGWPHDWELTVDSLELVEYAMRFIEASYRSRLT